MQLFSEFMKERVENARSKIHHLFQYLKTRDELVPELRVTNDQPYIFVMLKPSQPGLRKLEGLGLGVKIFDVGSKLVYRLQHGRNGTPIGPSRVIEDHDRIRDEIEKGKNEDQAYNEMFARIPDIISEFMNKVHKNIHKRVEGEPVDMDAEKQREIINAIVASV